MIKFLNKLPQRRLQLKRRLNLEGGSNSKTAPTRGRLQLEIEIFQYTTRKEKFLNTMNCPINTVFSSNQISKNLRIICRNGCPFLTNFSFDKISQKKTLKGGSNSMEDPIRRQPEPEGGSNSRAAPTRGRLQLEGGSNSTLARTRGRLQHEDGSNSRSAPT